MNEGNQYWKWCFPQKLKRRYKKDYMTRALDKWRHEVIIHRLRTGHAGIYAHSYRIKNQENVECEECQQVDTIEYYMLNCKSHEEARSKLIRNLQLTDIQLMSLKILLGVSHTITNSKQTS